jgi:glycerophosphoryl diester phosphodiesterase
VLIQNFEPTSLMKIHQLDPSLPLVQLFPGSMDSPTIQGFLNAVEAYAVGIGRRRAAWTRPWSLRRMRAASTSTRTR